MKNHEIIDLYYKYLKQFHLRKLVQTHVTLEMNRVSKNKGKINCTYMHWTLADKVDSHAGMGYQF